MRANMPSDRTRLFGDTRHPLRAIILWVPKTSQIRRHKQSSPQGDRHADFVASKDGNALMKAFARLPTDVQRSVAALVEKKPARRSSR